MARILIAGAGIGGLTAALSLSRIGATVTLLERAAVLGEIGAGLQLSPNATRILEQMSVLDAVAARALRPSSIHVRGGRSGRTLTRMSLDDSERRWGAPYLVTHRADLQAALLAAATADPGISLSFATEVAGFGTTAKGVSVTVRQGRITRTLEGDALIGADGIRSMVRRRLVDGADALTETGRTAWRALVPAAAVDPSLGARETALWLGGNAHLVHYPLDGGRRINVVAITEDAQDAAVDFWSAPGDVETIRRRFAGWHPTARGLIASAPEWTTWPLFDRAPLATWNAGPIALLGDAAHPILPFFAQGAAQAIEDAAAIAQVVAASRDMAQALAKYSLARRDRATRVQDTSRKLGRLYHLAGPAAAARDLGMRLMGPHRLLRRYDWLYGS